MNERKYYAIDFNEKKQTILTSKQFLVYSFLLIKSHQSEDNTYLYKTDFTPAIFAKELKISRPTFNAAVKKLIDVGLIAENENYFIFKNLESFVSLPIKTMEQLIKWSKKCKNGGYLIPIFCGLYKFFCYCHQNGLPPEIRIEKIKQIYFKTTNRSKESDEVLAIQNFFDVLRWMTLIDYKIKIDGEIKRYVITFATKEPQEYNNYREEEINIFLGCFKWSH